MSNDEKIMQWLECWRERFTRDDSSADFIVGDEHGFPSVQLLVATDGKLFAGSFTHRTLAGAAIRAMAILEDNINLDRPAPGGVVI